MEGKVRQEGVLDLRVFCCHGVSCFLVLCNRFCWLCAVHAFVDCYPCLYDCSAIHGMSSSPAVPKRPRWLSKRKEFAVALFRVIHPLYLSPMDHD